MLGANKSEDPKHSIKDPAPIPDSLSSNSIPMNTNLATMWRANPSSAFMNWKMPMQQGVLQQGFRKDRIQSEDTNKPSGLNLIQDRIFKSA